MDSIFNYHIIASSSKGNCYLVETNNTLILIDCGTSYKYIKASFEKLGLSLDDVSHILISHSHGDHILSLRTLKTRHPNIEIHASKDTIKEILAKTPYKKMTPNDFSEKTLDKSFLQFEELVVFPREAVHDVTCYGFLLIDPDTDKTIVHMTDTSSFESIMSVKNASLYALECNYITDDLFEDIESKTTDSKPKEFLDYLFRKFDTHMSYEDFREYKGAVLDANPSAKFVELHPSDSHFKKYYTELKAVLDKTPMTFTL